MLDSTTDWHENNEFAEFTFYIGCAMTSVGSERAEANYSPLAFAEILSSYSLSTFFWSRA